MPDIRQIAQDSDFRKLPIEEQRKAFSEYDKDFAALAPAEQDKGISELIKTPTPGAQKLAEATRADNPIESAYKGLANLGRQAGDMVSGIVKKSGITEPITQSLGDLYKSIKSTDIGKMILQPQEETLAGVGRGVNALAERYPQSAEVLKQGMDIANLIPIAQGMKAAAPMAGKALLEGELIGRDVAGRAGTSLRNLAGKVVPEGAPQRILESGAKWSTTLRPEVRKQLSDTMLNNEITLSPKGYDKLSSTVGSINDRIKGAIQPFKDNAIDAETVAGRASEARTKAAGAYDSAGEIAKVDGEVEKFLGNWQGKLTVEKAQAIKQDIYKQLKRHYESVSKGGPGLYADGEIAAKKNIARGLKEEIEAAVPTEDIKALNAQESALLNLEPHLRRAVGRIENHNILSIDDVLAASAGAVFGGAPGAAAAGIAKKSLGSPAIKSKIAMALKTLSDPAATPELQSEALKSLRSFGKDTLPPGPGRNIGPSTDAPLQYPPTTITDTEFMRPTVDKQALLRADMPTTKALPPGQGFSLPTPEEQALQRMARSTPKEETPIIGGTPENQNVNLLLNDKIKAALDKPAFQRTAEDQLLIKRGFGPSTPMSGSDIRGDIIPPQAKDIKPEYTGPRKESKIDPKLKGKVEGYLSGSGRGKQVVENHLKDDGPKGFVEDAPKSPIGFKKKYPRTIEGGD